MITFCLFVYIYTSIYSGSSCSICGTRAPAQPSVQFNLPSFPIPQTPVVNIQTSLPTTWSCQACTFTNASSRNRCEICSEPKPSSASSSSSSSSSASAPASSSVATAPSTVVEASVAASNTPVVIQVLEPAPEMPQWYQELSEVGLCHLSLSHTHTHTLSRLLSDIHIPN